MRRYSNAYSQSHFHSHPYTHIHTQSKHTTYISTHTYPTANRVRWASNKQNKKMKEDDETKIPHGPSVFVVFLVYNKNAIVTEMQLRSVFQAYGNVDDVVVKQSKTDPVSQLYTLHHIPCTTHFTHNSSPPHSSTPFRRLLASRRAMPSSSTPQTGQG
ncbi:hypothetical protein EON63_05470 [archaeon]|nr:MAG: hypothetical protein EON63_05470 [archaeon]